MEAAKPIIRKIAPLPVPPFLLDDRVYDALSEEPLLDRNLTQPLRKCRIDPATRLLTDCIQHPGQPQENAQVAGECHRRSPTEGTRPNIQRTPWALLEVR